MLILLVAVQRPQAQSGAARIFFVDIGQGAATLIVSPAGKTLLVDSGPPGGGTKIGALLGSLGIGQIDYTVLTHYHIDHDSGFIELANAGKIGAGTVAYDVGDDSEVQPPGTSTASNSTRGTYLNYKTALQNAGATRQTVTPGQVIDLGGGMTATVLAAAGHLLSGGSVEISNEDLNSESISLLVEYNDFDYIVSGDLTGGGSTSTAKTIDVETFVGQLAGDVDVAQLNHHGSTTTSNQVYLSAVKAEVAVAQAGTSNTFGHPNRETVNKYLNTPSTNGQSYGGTGVPPVGAGAVFYQHEESPTADDRVTHQGYTGASAANAGLGTILLQVDGTTGPGASYSLTSFDDGGARLNPTTHTYLVDGASPGRTTNFPPTVIPSQSPAVPLATEDATIAAAVDDRESPITAVMLSYAVNGVDQTPVAMTLSGGLYRATIPAQPDGVRVDWRVSGTAGGQTTTYEGGYFSGTTPAATLRALNALGESRYNGYGARVVATVTAGSNTFGSGTNDDYVQDASGAINIGRTTDTPTPYTSTTVGQTATVVGRVGFLGGRQRLDVSEVAEYTSSPYGVSVSAGTEPVPASTTIASLNANPESFEGQLVSLNDVTIVSGSLPTTPQSVDTFVTISDGTGTFSLKVDKDTDIEGFNPGTTFDVVGIVQQDDFLRPFDSGYNLAPRGRADMGGTPAGTTLITIAEARVDEIENVSGMPGADFVPDLLNQLVKVRGAVTSVDFRGGNGIEYYIQDSTGGIDLFSTTLNAGPFAVGDSVEAVGQVTHFNGLTELTVSSVAALAPGTIAPATPQVVTLAQLTDGGVGESLEGHLIRVNNVTITAGSYPATNGSGNVTITDATGSAVMRIDSDTNIDGTTTPSGTLSVIGVLGQFDSSSPFDSGYQLFPRTLADITEAGASAITATPTSWDFGSVAVGGTALKSFTITNTSGSPVTLTTPFTVGGTNANQFAAGAPGTTTLAAGGSTTVSVTFQPTTVGAKSATLNVTSSNGSAVVALTGSASGSTGSGSPVLISEFRFRGPNSASDEFVELYNNSDAPVSIAGYALRRSNGSGSTFLQVTVPAGVMIPAHGHYLIGNSGAGAPNAALFNLTYGTSITDDGGIALLLPNGTTIVDQVGTSSNSAYKEGTPLATLTGTDNKSYERKLGGVQGSQQDTNNNAADFQLISPSTPQNLASEPTPSIAVAPTSVDFGSVVVGGTTSIGLTVTNLSSASSVTLDTPFTPSGADAASFNVSAPGTTTLAPGASTTVSVSFQPESSGAHSATLTIATLGAGSVTLALTGTATGGIVVAPASIDFGTRPVGSTSSATVTVSAESPVTLTPPFTITGANASEFFVGSPSTTAVGPGSDATVAVGFQPTTVGPKSASLLIASVDGGSQTVALSGSVACPAIAIAGSLPSGIVGAPYAQSLSATGGTAPYAFTVSAGSLPPGLALSTSGAVSGTPASAGSYPVTIVATDVNGCPGSRSFTIPVAAATLSAAPASVAFGVVATSTSATTNVTVTNTSGFSVTLQSPFAITGTGAAQYSAGAPATTTLNAGASTTVPVTFAPAAVGVASATMTITSSGGGSLAVPLSGTGRAASVTHAVVISEFRFHGPAMGNDEFIELYNTSDAPVGIGGVLLRGSNSGGTVSTRATVPAGVTIPAHGHYLFVNGASPLAPMADQTYGTGITDDGGVAIALGDGTIVDQVGLSLGSAFGEGDPLAPLTTNTDRSYERKIGGANGSGVDTNDNADDFLLITPSAPQNLASTITPALTVTPAVIDFGTIVRGTATNATMTIANQAASPVSLTVPFALAGPNVGEFAVGAPATTTVGAGAATAATVTFQPTSIGAKSALVTVTSTIGETHLVELSGLAVCPAIAVTGTLPPVDRGTAYSQTIAAVGGLAPYAFAVTSGTLPAGLTLSGAGVLSGTPTQSGSFTFTTTAVEDGAACAGAATFTLVVTEPPPTALVGGPVTINSGRIEGLVRVTTGANVTFNGSATVEGDLLIAGTPTVTVNGHPAFDGVTDGTGSASPTGHRVTINGGVTLGHVVRRTDGIALPVVPLPPASAGTRSVVLNRSSDSPGDFATLRDLTVNGSVGAVAVPTGTYRSFVANGSNAFVLGVAGSTTPAVYDFESLTLNGSSTLQVAGPVIVTVRNALSLNGSAGAAEHPEWLTLRVATGGLTLNGTVSLYGFVVAPSGTVIVNGGTQLVGGVTAGSLTLNSNGKLVLLPQP